MTRHIDCGTLSRGPAFGRRLPIRAWRSLTTLFSPDAAAGRPCWVLSAIFASLLCLWPQTSVAQIQYDPNHPEVKRMVRAAVAYLKSDLGGGWGESVLSGLAILNSYDDYGFREDPVVNKAVQTVLSAIPDYAQRVADGFDGHNLRQHNPDDKKMYRLYEPCVALMLLVEYNDQAYDREIRTLIDFIVRRQDARGGWSYNQSPNSDTSQTQYCCLALWLAHHKGFDIPLDHSVSAVRFWIAHQFSDGSWDYHPIGNQRGSEHVSLVSAGAGSLYMLGDILGVNPPPKRLVTRKQGDVFADLPSFVERLTPREVENLLADQAAKKEEKEVPKDVPVQALNAAKQRANGWFGRNFRTETNHWAYYALYGFERYATFREKVDGAVSEVPDWYDQGVEYIKQKQNAEGYVNQIGEGGPPVHTSLAVLFLVRSTLRLTNLPKDASLDGGMGLGPKTNIRGGKVINEEEKRDIAELLNRVKADMSPDELQDIADSFRNAAVSSIKDKSRSQQLLMLKEMVKNEHWQIRMVAVRALGQVRLIDNCPALIYALTDPNPTVVQEASIALQFVSRKTQTPPVPTAKLVGNEYDTDDDKYKQGIRELYEYWSQWYLSLKPDAQLLPVDLK